MKLPIIPSKMALKNKRIFLRVDWNVPMIGGSAEDSLKLTRSIKTVQALAKRKAVILVATHLGRPKKRDPKLSTKQLAHLVLIRYGVDLVFLGEDLSTIGGRTSALKIINAAKPGSIFLLENVRFYQGEEKNTLKLAKAFASLADIFVNDAFASSHRAHASVVGVAKVLPHYAGPTLVEEVRALEKLLMKPKRPYVAVIGGAKLSTKLPVLKTFLSIADVVCVGGAMAHPFFVAQKKRIGKSYIEKEGIPLARKLLKNPKLRLPVDAVVATKIAPGVHVRATAIDGLKQTEAIGDIGPETMRAWAQEIKRAKTIVWNGPLGVADIPAFSHGSLLVARVIAARSKGPAYGVVGGGDTLPIVLATGMSEWFDHISTGGGAMVEFIATKGKLPGLVVLERTQLKHH